MAVSPGTALRGEALKYKGGWFCLWSSFVFCFKKKRPGKPKKFFWSSIWIWLSALISYLDSFFSGTAQVTLKEHLHSAACSVCHYLTCCWSIFLFPLFGRRHFPFLRASNILPKHTVCCFPTEGKKEWLNLLFSLPFYVSRVTSLKTFSFPFIYSSGGRG